MYPSNRKKKVWKEEKERLLKMTLEERRKEYVRDFVPLKDIPSWKEEMKSKSQNDASWVIGKEPFIHPCLPVPVHFASRKVQ